MIHPNTSSVIHSELMRREVASPRCKATFYLRPTPNAVLTKPSEVQQMLAHLIKEKPALGAYDIPYYVRSVIIIQILQKENYVNPFVVAMQIKSRTDAAKQCLWLYGEMKRCIQESYDLDQTIDWWSRPLHDAGLGYLTIGFRPCDIREMV